MIKSLLIQLLKQLKEMKGHYGDLETKFKNEIEANQTLIIKLQDEISYLEKHARADEDNDRGTYEQKVTGYEQLLSEVQLDINEKDKELSHYKRRIASLEKRLKLGATSPLQEKPILEESSAYQKPEVHALSFLDFATVFNDKRCMVRGDLIITNVGTKPLETPYICFRYNPGDAAQIKGRIKTWETVEPQSVNADQWEWVFLDNKWAKEARDRGEIWIYPTKQATIQPGEHVVLNDWQIPIERKYYDQLSVEAFVFFEEGRFRVKGRNQIIINFK